VELHHRRTLACLAFVRGAWPPRVSPVEAHAPSAFTPTVAHHRLGILDVPGAAIPWLLHRALRMKARSLSLLSQGIAVR
jgi:hypothetical protein